MIPWLMFTAFGWAAHYFLLRRLTNTLFRWLAGTVIVLVIVLVTLVAIAFLNDVITSDLADDPARLQEFNKRGGLGPLLAPALGGSIAGVILGAQQARHRRLRLKTEAVEPYLKPTHPLRVAEGGQTSMSTAQSETSSRKAIERAVRIIVIAALVAVATFFLMRQYNPRLGIVWNIINGEIDIDGTIIGYRWVFIAAMAAITYGGWTIWRVRE